MAAQIGYYDTLKSVAGKVFSFLSSITLTGTDGKTLTVTQDTSLDEAVAMSSKAPKASPEFTGDVKGTTAGALFANVNPTNSGVQHVGGSGNIAVADNQSFNITVGAYGALIMVSDNQTGNSALFFVTYSSATITKLSDIGGVWQITDLDTGSGYAIFKNAASLDVTIKNYQNAVAAMRVCVFGMVGAATAPA